MAKGLVAGILATAAAYVAFKSLPQEKQDELIKKAKDTGNKLKDLGYDAAYAGADLAGDLSEKAKNKVGEFDEQIKDSKYADTYQGVKDKAADVIDQASPYVEKAKDKAYDLVDKASPYVDKAKDTIDDLRHRFSKEDIDLEEDAALKDDLTKPDSDEKEDK